MVDDNIQDNMPVSDQEEIRFDLLNPKEFGEAIIEISSLLLQSGEKLTVEEITEKTSLDIININNILEIFSQKTKGFRKEKKEYTVYFIEKEDE